MATDHAIIRTGNFSKRDIEDWLTNMKQTMLFNVQISGGAGNVVFYPTDDGTPTGVALFSSIDYVQPLIDVPDPLKAFGRPVVSNGRRTVTINVKQSQQNLVSILGISVIGSTTLANAPDGTALTVLIAGTLN